MKMISLYFWVEGPRDESFFRRIIKPALSRTYRVRVNPHSEDPDDEISDIADVLKSKGQMAVLVVDRDSHNHPCRQSCKDAWLARYPAFSADDIRIAEEMIEGWYIAGAPREVWQELGIPDATNVDALSKREFERLVRRSRLLEKEFRSRLLRSYDIALAKTRSTSFARFCGKYGL